MAASAAVEMETLAQSDAGAMVKALPHVSITIAQWGKVDFTERCVEALFKSEYEGTYEILVFDNDSPGGAGRVADLNDVTMHKAETNIGFGPAQNHLARMARGEFLLILNNDTIVTPSALRRLVSVAVEQSDVGAVTPRYMGFDGQTMEMGGFIGRSGRGWQLFRNEEPPPFFTRNQFVADYGSAACLLTPRELFLEMEGFDDIFAPAYYEDTDYCFRLWQAGFGVVVEPTAIVYHYEGATAGRDISTGMKKLQELNRTKFVQRWEDQLEPRDSVSSDNSVARALGLASHSTLWITPEIPRPDHEAGHARMLSMLGELKAAGSSVVLWAEMAPEWERYSPRLEDLGVPWFAYKLSGRLGGESSSAYSTTQDLLRLANWDVVVISFPEMARRVVPLIRGFDPNIRIIVDAVDLHFLRMERAPDTTDQEAQEYRESELSVYRSVDGVITASDYELDLLVDVAPEVIAENFSSVPTMSLSSDPLSSSTGDIVFLGNLNHPPNVAAVDHWVEEIASRLPLEVGMPLVLYGSGSERFIDRWPEEAVEVRGWAPGLEDVFRSSRVFAAPLTYGAGTKGKILEAAAAGVPVVTSSIGAEGYSGFLLDALFIADEPQQFAATVEKLLVDDDAWNRSREKILSAMRSWELSASVERSEWASWILRKKRLVAE